MQKGARKRSKPVSMIEAAEIVLKQSKTPLHSNEIISIAMSKGPIRPVGKTPDRSLQAAIWRDIHEARKGDSPFIMVGTGEGTTNRRYWLKGKT